MYLGRNAIEAAAHQGAYAPRSPVMFAALCALAGTLSAAPPQVTFLYPSGGQIGQSVFISAGGTFSNWPVQTWSDRSDVAIECDKDKGKLLVKIGPAAAPGVAWLRLFGGEGASTVRPFVIGALAEVIEQEPNDEPRKPQQLSGSTVANGQLGRNGDVDGFAISLAKGQTMVAAMDANRVLGSPMDAALQIVSPDGFVLAQNDDERGTDPLLAFTAPVAGTYLVRTFAFPATANSSINFAGGDSFVYRLTLTTEAFVDAALPLALSANQTNRLALLGWNLPEDVKTIELKPASEPRILLHPPQGNTLTLPVVEARCFVGSETTEIEFPAVLSGQLAKPGQLHEFTFAGKKGQRLVFQSESRTLGYAIDPVLAIVDTSGKQVAQNDDSGRDSREAELTFNVPADGTYRLIVRDLHRQGGPRYVYRVTAGPPRTDFALKLAADAFTLAPGKSLEIAVSVDRQGGFAEEIEIATSGLPEGVTAEPMKSAAKGDSSKSVKLKLTAASDASFNGPLRIIGRTLGEASQTRIAAAPLASLGATIEDVWLTITRK